MIGEVNMRRRQTQAMRKVLSEHESCELCGSNRELQAHHIIPVSLGGRDVEENILCVCAKCHTPLTPHSVLTKNALNIHRNLPLKFYQYFHEWAESGDNFDAIDVMDYLDAEIFPYVNILQKLAFEKEA